MRVRNRKSAGLLVVVIVIGILAAILGVALSDDRARPTSVPAATDRFFVNDFADILSAEDAQAVYEMGVALYNATKAQVVLVTVEDTGDMELEEYSYTLANTWGIGQAEEDNGILLLFTTEGPHSRIEVGYGLEGALPDSKAGRILDTYLVPWYEDAAAYSTRLRDTYTAILNVVYGEYGLENSQLPLDTPLPEEEEFGLTDLLIMLPFLIVLILALCGGRGHWVFLGGGHYRGGMGGGFRGGGGGFRGGGGGFGGGGASR